MPGVNAPNVAGVPSVSDSVALTVPPGVVVRAGARRDRRGGGAERQVSRRRGVADPDLPRAVVRQPLLRDLVPVLERARVQRDRLVLGLARVELDPVEAAQRADGLLDARLVRARSDVDLRRVGAGARAGVLDVEADTSTVPLRFGVSEIPEYWNVVYERP